MRGDEGNARAPGTRAGGRRRERERGNHLRRILTERGRGHLAQRGRRRGDARGGIKGGAPPVRGGDGHKHTHHVTGSIQRREQRIPGKNRGASGEGRGHGQGPGPTQQAAKHHSHGQGLYSRYSSLFRCPPGTTQGESPKSRQKSATVCLRNELSQTQKRNTSYTSCPIPPPNGHTQTGGVPTA